MFPRRRAVKFLKLTAVVVCVLAVAPVSAQRRRGRGGAPQAPATDTVAPGIPGVVAAGTPVTVIKEGFQGTEGPITLPDGSVIFSEPQANRIIEDRQGRERLDVPGEFERIERSGVRLERPADHHADSRRAGADRRRLPAGCGRDACRGHWAAERPRREQGWRHLYHGARGSRRSSITFRRAVRR